MTDDIVIIQMGGLGDLVLTAPLVAGLTAGASDRRVTLVCRDAYAGLPALYPVPPAQVIACPINPYLDALPDSATLARIDHALDLLPTAGTALVIDAGLQPTWFSWCAPAVLRPRRAIHCGLPGQPGVMAATVLERHGLPLPTFESVALPPDAHERDRYQQLLAAAAGQTPADSQWTLPVGALDHSRQWLAAQGLAAQGLAGRRHIVCFPGGTEAAAIKRWPRAHYAEALTTLIHDHGLAVVIAGETSEHADLAALLGQLPPESAALFAGSPADLPLLAGLLVQAGGWLGNDTGPVHLAQALGVPGVTLFGGGGQWPRYAPWGPGTTGLVRPLPCFGCAWDCVLGHALCVESLPVAAVVQAMAAIVDGAGNRAPQSVTLDPLEPALAAVLADASRRYRAAQNDRAERLEIILTSRQQIDRQTRRAEALEIIAGERLAVIEASIAAAGRIYRQLEQPVAARDQRIAELEAVAAERLTLLNLVHAEAELRARCLEDVSANLAALRNGLPGPIRATQICCGLGAGNIGDELMARAFWAELPPGMVLDVPLFDEAGRQRAPYPSPHRYRIGAGTAAAPAADHPGLLVGATPVTEAEGLHWPLEFLAPRLEAYHRAGQPVDAIGVGVDRLDSAPALALFERAFLPIRSWTVRSPACRKALLAMGVPDDCIRVGADWAWRHVADADGPDDRLTAWASGQWRDWGIDPDRPLLVVNVVNLIWGDQGRRAIAGALTAARRRGLQIAFFCNECRDGDFYDAAAAAATAAQMPGGAIIVPNLYFAPAEAIALLSHATLTLGQRYHLVVQSVLAGTVPIAVPRGQKMSGLVEELGCPAVGPLSNLDQDALDTVIGQTLAGRQDIADRLQVARLRLAERAGHNLDFLKTLPPYAAAFATGR